LDIGIDRYRREDFFQQPHTSFSESDLAFVGMVMAQLADGHGFKKEDPLTGIRSMGIHLLLPVVHFKFGSVFSIPMGDGILDEYTGIHVVSGAQVVLFNLVSRD
jgi:hypothetical protein